MRPALSVVVPCHNERGNLPRLLRSIEEHLGRFRVQTVVVENASTDGTAEVADGFGCTTLRIPERVNPATARNRGAREARHPVVAFLDADTEVTARWAATLEDHWEAFVRDPHFVAGYDVAVPDDPSLIERVWFAPLAGRRDNFVNSANLLTSRQVLDALDGFDERLDTGEDADFTRRATAAGARKTIDPGFHLIHHGFPTTLVDFVRRERWHGRGDWATLRDWLGSRVALASSLFLAGHLVVLVALPLGRPAVAAGAAAAVVGLCGASSWSSFRDGGPGRKAMGAALYYVYFVGRVLSLFDVVVSRLSSRGPPSSWRA